MSSPAITPNAEPLNPLVGKIRAAHPGAYDDMDDGALTKAVLAKYPQYEDLARPASAIPGAPSTQPPMQKSNLGIAAGSENTERSAIANPQQPAEQFALEHPEEQGKLLGASAIGAGGIVAPAAARAAVPPIARFAAKHPIIAQTVGSAAIGEARHIPYVGKLIPPYAEMLPFLLGGKGKKEPIEPDATGENRPFAGGIDEPKPIRPPRQRSTPTPIGEQPEAPTIAPEIRRVPSTNELRETSQIAKPGSRADRLEDRAIQQENSGWLENQGRMADSEARRRAIAGSSTGITKGDLVKKAAATGPRGISQGTPATNDLTPLLEKSLQAAKKAKGKIAKPGD